MSLLAGLGISFVLPLMGLLVFLLIVWLMAKSEAESPPVGAIFWIFVFYGGCLQLVLTVRHWRWGTAAMVGTLVLVTIGPFLLGWQAWKLRKQCKESVFHVTAFSLCLLYPAVLVLALFLSVT